MAGNLTIFGGHFQDATGAVLDSGYLLFELSHDEQYTVGSSQIVAGLKFRIALNSAGDIPTTPAVKIYSNDVMLPSGSFYLVRAFASDGREVWNAPQYWQLTATPNPLDVGTIVPANPPGSGLSGTGGATLLLETNGVSNSSQSLLNLQNGNGITITNPSSGNVSIAGAIQKTDGVANSTQTTLNLKSGTNVTLSAGSGGDVTINSSSGGSVPLLDTAQWMYSTIAYGAATTSASYANPVGDIWSQSTVAAATTDGPATPSASDLNAYIRLIITAVNDTIVVGSSRAMGGGVSTGAWYTGKAITWIGKARFAETPLNLRAWVGLFGAAVGTTISASDSPASANVLAFRESPAGSAGNWFAVTGNAGVYTATDTGIAADTTQKIFKIMWTPGVNAVFSINGSVVATITTNLPASNVTLYPMISLVGKASASTTHLHYSGMYIQQADI